jgi:hypothetical protein
MIRSSLQTLLLIVCASATLHAQKAPANGTEVLRRMHDAYGGKWYRTLTFDQTTTQYSPAGEPRVSKWRESLRHDPGRGAQLRIDVGDPADNNVILYTADSVWVVRAGKLVRTGAHGNEFLPLIEGVYMQPVERTARELRGLGFNLDHVFSGQWNGCPAWIVGAASPSDSMSPQFWVDKEHNIVVHAVIAPGPNAPPIAIALDKYEPLAGGWLATKVSMTMAGRPMQTEEYANWQGNIDVPAGLFDPSQWPAAAPPK